MTFAGNIRYHLLAIAQPYQYTLSVSRVWFFWFSYQRFQDNAFQKRIVAQRISFEHWFLVRTGLVHLIKRRHTPGRFNHCLKKKYENKRNG